MLGALVLFFFTSWCPWRPMRQVMDCRRLRHKRSSAVRDQRIAYIASVKSLIADLFMHLS